MAVPLQPIAISPVLPAVVLLAGSQTRTMAVSLQGSVVCILLPQAAFPVRLAGVVSAALAEPGPEPPGWSAIALPEISRPPNLLPPGE